MTGNTQQVKAPRVEQRPARVNFDQSDYWTYFVEYVRDGVLRRCGHKHKTMDAAADCAETKDRQHIDRQVKAYLGVPQETWDEIDSILADVKARGLIAS